MTDRLIADYLRGATRARVIVGWYHTGPRPENAWVVNSREAGARQMTREEIVQYAGMLAESGVEPMPIFRPA